MDKEIKFKSLKELYERVLPALKSRQDDLKKKGFTYIHEEDIWNYLKNYKWNNSKELDLSSIVNDIFTISDGELNTYVKEKLESIHRDIESDE